MAHILQEVSMFTRKPAVAASLAAAALACMPAAVHATDVPAPNVSPGACTDQSPPQSGFTSRAAKQAKRTHVLRGTASDVGCGLDRVDVSVARKVGKRCRYLTGASRISRSASTCGRPAAWLRANGTTRWSFRLPKRLARGTYILRTRATDFAGNVQHLRSKRLHIR
jgi:hypothetical protein